MKLSNSLVSSVLLTFLIINPIRSQIVDTSTEIICNQSDPSDCYPKLFEPTNQWQIIRESQDIPPGLHVRLNIDTLQREAKLMDPEEQNQEGITDVVMKESPEHFEQPRTQQELQRDKIQQKIQELQKGDEKSKVSSVDLNSFQASVDELEVFDGDLNQLTAMLDNLIELSHDIEFGIKLTQDKSTFENLNKLLSQDINEEIKEKIYRIMGSTLRNNPDAINNVLNNQPAEFVTNLFNQVAKEKSDIIQKRILGIIQALNQNTHFNLKFFNNEKNDSNLNFGVNNLIDIFPILGSQSKQRLINILEDLNLIESNNLSNDKRSVEESTNSDLHYSNFIQDTLANSNIASDSQFKLFFNKLTEIHQQNKSLKPSKDFLQWLSNEAQLRAKNNKRDNYSKEDQEFDNELLRARHVVFGNPNALRKALADEL